jgi:hypothetical protein
MEADPGMLMRAIWTVLFMLAVTYPAGSQQLQPERDQRGTEEIPLIVKMLPAEQTEADRARDAEERERKAREAELVLFTEQLADYTDSLYVTTAALAFGTGVLILVGIGTAFWDHHSQKRRERTYVSGGGQVARGNRFEIDWLESASDDGGGRCHITTNPRRPLPVPAQKSKTPSKCSVSCTTSIPSWT